jgi:EAL domain-containing protein (putative c-di-GMP-specific phosphodiesterase class I)
VCEALTGQEEVASAALLRFTADGLAVPVACTGRPLWGLCAGDPVPGPLRRSLQARAAAGPWMENGPAARVVAGPALLTGSVACAPLRDEDALHGVLLVALDDEAVTWVDPNAALSSAIDAAGIVHGLLRSRFIDLHGSEVGRSELRTVLREQAFTPHFQPIVRLTDGHVAGVEALTRFADGSNPETRFREAALLGLGPDLEVATLTAALDAARTGLDADLWLSLNVSPAFVTAGDDRLVDVLDLRGHDVVLELSEQEIVADYDAVRAAVSAAGGLRLSVDDAGSGFASLRHILRLEPAFVKLDRSWVHHVDTDPARQAMIAGLRHFADSTGAELIAEGIERPEERDVLIDLRVDYGQGYLLGRPAALTA